jgi:hypothetical protein
MVDGFGYYVSGVLLKDQEKEVLEKLRLSPHLFPCWAESTLQITLPRSRLQLMPGYNSSFDNDILLFCELFHLLFGRFSLPVQQCSVQQCSVHLMLGLQGTMLGRLVDSLWQDYHCYPRRPPGSCSLPMTCP